MTIWSRCFTGAALALTAIFACQTSHAGWPDKIDEAAAELARQRSVPATGVTLVTDGQAQGVIVAGEDAAGEAAMLNTWLEKMSGATLPIQGEAPAAGQGAIYLGQAAIDAGLDLSGIESSTEEGIRVKADGKAVYIASQGRQFSLGRAVGRFLEEAFGCRWLETTTQAQLAPELTTLRVREMDFSEKPNMIFRRIWGAEGAFGNKSWLAWNGQGGRGLPMAHSWNFLSKEDFETNPEWFRTNEEGEREYGHWPNFGNPELRQKFIDWAVASSEGGTRSISLSPPDSYRYDYSPEATKYDNPNVIVATTGWVSMTDRFMGIVNEAATEIYKQGKDSVVSFYAYSDYTMPPTKPELDKLSPNVCVWIAPIRYSRYHPMGHPNSGSRQELLHIVDGWAERASMLGYRTYNYNLAEILTPFSKLGVWTHDIPYIYSRGCVGINLESMDSWELSGPHLYQSIRLGYDPELDPEMITADYFAAAYGPAAADMADYWRAVDDAWVNQKTEAGSIHVLPQIWSPEFIAELDGYLTKAEAAAKSSPANAEMVAASRRGLIRAQYWRSWFDQVNSGDIAAAMETTKTWGDIILEARKARNANKYETNYLNRFVINITNKAYYAVFPKEGPERKVVAVLPDEWKYATGEFARTWPEGTNPYDVDLDDHIWPTMKTYSATLSAQGQAEYFGDMWYRTSIDVPAGEGKYFLHAVKADRKLTVYVNGQQVNAEELEAFRGATVDVSEHLKPGETNQITLKIRHVPLPELFLGGLIAPVYLINGAE